MIEIKTPARLHLGLLDTNGNLGRLYGSIGVAIERPNVILRAESADSLEAEGLETERVLELAHRFLDTYPIEGGAHLSLNSSIQTHVGLGSGTQLALAIGVALARLGGKVLSYEKIALAMGRGVHSGIGINTFQYGGFILDGGHRIDRSGSASNTLSSNEGSVPPALFRQPVPEDWFFVIVVPETDTGFSGEREKIAFQRLPEALPSHVEKLCRLLVMKMLPSLVEKDITNFGQALTEIQRLVGDSFADVQGGRFANPLSEQLIGFLLDHGAAGAGQSSWGPTVYGLVKGEDSAQRLMEKVEECLPNCGKGQTFYVRPDNRGAIIQETEPEDKNNGF